MQTLINFKFAILHACWIEITYASVKNIIID